MPRSAAQVILLILLASLPVAIMSGQMLPSPVYYAVLLVALGLLAGTRDRWAALGIYRCLLLCLAAPTLAVLFSAVWHGRLSGSDLEISLRVLLGCGVLLLALHEMPHRMLRWVIGGYVLAALVAAVFIVYLTVASGGARPRTDAVYNAVGYGSLTALLAFVALYAVSWRLTPWPRTETLIKVFVAALAATGFILTRTRTVWLAVPVFIVIAVMLFVPPKRPWRTLGVMVMALALVGAAFLSSDMLRTRVQTAYHEMQDCTGQERTADTSICIRLQLWHASWDMFLTHPVAGLGKRGLFGAYLGDESLARGIVSPYVAKHWGEPHNDLLLALASFGVPGGLALLLVYLAPAWLFIRRLGARQPQSVRAAAAMGLAFCLGFLLFGMPETMWRGMRTVSFYAVSIAVFLVLSDPVKYGNDARADQE